MGSQMAVEFSYTFDDLREALAPEVPGQARSKRQKSKSRGVYGWIFYAFLALVVWLLYRASSGHMAPRAAAPPARLAPPPPTQNLMLLLAPHITVAGFLLMFLLVRIFQPVKPPKPSEIPGQRKAFLTAIVPTILIMAFFCFVVPVNMVADEHSRISVYWAPTPGEQLLWSYGVWGIAVAIVVVVTSWSGRRTMRRTWNALQSYHRPKRLEFDDSGFIMTDDAGEHRIRWCGLARYRETDNLLLVYDENSQRWIFPKRAFTDPAEMMHFRALLQTHIAVGQFLPQESAFPVVLVPVKPV